MGCLYQNEEKEEYQIQEWENDSQGNFNKVVHELRKNGFRKVSQYESYTYYFEKYKKRGSKRTVKVVMLYY